MTSYLYRPANHVSTNTRKNTRTLLVLYSFHRSTNIVMGICLISLLLIHYHSTLNIKTVFRCGLIWPRAHIHHFDHLSGIQDPGSTIIYSHIPLETISFNDVI